jgi:NAD(P)-dependent dehydrogenase (short-subunit alcohol dehydrogenase family)
MDISGKTVIVIGAASGIALGIATALAEAAPPIVRSRRSCLYRDMASCRV